MSSDNVALVLSFLGRMFIDANSSNIAAARLESALDDELFALNQRLGEERFPRRAVTTSSIGQRRSGAGCAASTRAALTNPTTT